MIGSASTGWKTSIDPPPAGKRPELLLRQIARPGTTPPGSRRPPAKDDEADSGRLAVRIIDNPVNTYEEVIGICATVLGVSEQRGFAIAYAVDHEGSCVVGDWPKAEATQIAEEIASIGIEVRLEPAAG